MGESVLVVGAPRDRQPGDRDARRARGPRQGGQPRRLRARGPSCDHPGGRGRGGRGGDGPPGRGCLGHLRLRQPPYHRWPADWPPITTRVLGTAERSGAVLVTLSNLYGYASAGLGGYDEAHPITEATPLAATGPRAGSGPASGRTRWPRTGPGGSGWPRSGPPISSARARRARWAGGSSGTFRQGKNVSVLGRADRPHTWSFTGDVARMLVTAGTDPGGLGTCLARTVERTAQPSVRPSTTSPGPPGTVRSASARSPRSSCAE